MRLDDATRATIIGHHTGPLLARRAPGVKNFEWDFDWNDPPLTELANSQAAQFISGVAWHCHYGLISVQEAVHDQHPDKETWPTEITPNADYHYWRARITAPSVLC